MKYLFITMLFIFSFCTSEKRDPNSVPIGATKVKVEQLSGKPDLLDTVQKNTEIIWGAEEGFWDELAMGTVLEIWIYRRGENEIRLYFINESDTLSFKVVTPKDAVYESVN
jgi:hypothetical protein